GVIEPIFPDQPKSPKQKYRLTEKGKALLEKR
ncbi:Fic family protein, partial [Phocaeicola vulgatus]